LQKDLKSQICGLVLAAGMSTRMEAFKPLLPLRGKTLIENTIDSLLTGGAGQVVVVLGYRGEELEPLLSSCYGEQVLPVWNRDFANTDMLHSVQIGCAALPECEAFFLLPGDMPVIEPETFRRLLQEWEQLPTGIIFPTLNGYRKHPPLIDAQMIPAIRSFTGEGGLRQLWSHHEDQIRTVSVEDPGVWIDLDTRADYHSCRKKYEQ
jgi:CTP:molybdopterin cytidylyltransferase MocA